MKISKPRRASHSYTQTLVAPPSTVFPLMCPVREADWLQGWDPVAVYSSSGFAEPDCVFTTPADGTEAIWYITRHDSESCFVEMLKITPGVTACRLTIAVHPDGAGSLAAITYSHTSLGPKGDEFVEAFTKSAYLSFMKNWETRVNYYLQHGKMMLDAA